MVGAAAADHRRERRLHTVEASKQSWGGYRSRDPPAFAQLQSRVAPLGGKGRGFLGEHGL